MSDSPDERQADSPPEPRSVRDGLGGGSGEGGDDSRSGPKPARSGGPVPVRESLGAGDSQRPTPVREAMDARRDRREPLEPPSLSFEVGGEEWVVRAEGRAVTGGAGDAGVPLLFLTFARASEPERRLREVVAAGRRLDDLGPSELAVLFDDARPFEDSWEGSELFPETRKSRKSSG